MIIENTKDSKVETTATETKQENTTEQKVQQDHNKIEITKKDFEEFQNLKQNDLARKQEDLIKEALKTSGLKANVKHLIKILPNVSKIENEKLVEELNKLAKDKETSYLFNGKFGIETKISKDEKEQKGARQFVEGGTVRKKTYN
jgi:diaminopimelate epimerase